MKLSKFAMVMVATLVSVTASADFTKKPVAPAKQALPETVYSCDGDTILLKVRGPIAKGDYALELKNATLGSDEGLDGTSNPGDCVKVERQEMYTISIPVCTVKIPGGNTHRVSFTGFEGSINQVNLIGANASANCRVLPAK